MTWSSSTQRVPCHSFDVTTKNWQMNARVRCVSLHYILTCNGATFARPHSYTTRIPNKRIPGLTLANWGTHVEWFPGVIDVELTHCNTLLSQICPAAPWTAQRHLTPYVAVIQSVIRTRVSWRTRGSATRILSFCYSSVGIVTMLRLQVTQQYCRRKQPDSQQNGHITTHDTNSRLLCCKSIVYSLYTTWCLEFFNN